jgi:hypothetical protein
VRVAKGQDELGALHLASIADANELERAAVAGVDTRYHVEQQCTREAVHGTVARLVAGARDDQVAVVQGQVDLGHDFPGERALGARHLDVAAIDIDLHRVGDWDRLLTYSRHSNHHT